MVRENFKNIVKIKEVSRAKTAGEMGMNLFRS
jgi:hypothetical protein